MRVAAMIILIGPLGGCAARQATVAPAATVPQQPQYEAVTAWALVFDPPVLVGERPLDLPRDDRQPSAFVGFDGPITTYYWIHTDDLQDSSWGSGGSGGNGVGSSIGNRYQRRAFIDTAGVRYR
jgi:hypothetical protein